MERKLRIGIVSNCPVGGKTGLARNQKAILPLLYNTDKYELFFLAQGMSDNSTDFQRLPFKCEGVFKNFDQNRFNQDQGYQRIVSYGATAVEQFVLSNKLDCLVLSDDQWAFPNDFYLNTDWFKYMKKNILPIITADSLPLLPQIKEWAEKCENMSFWTNFAWKHLQKEDYNKFKHCKTVYGALKTSDFTQLSKQDRLNLRRSFNIADDEKIIMYLGRNQLRKIYGSHIKALAKFKKQNPNKKVKLLFHCSWSEQMGWPLDQIREQNGLAKEDILTTYYCQKCGHWHLQPFYGEGANCPICKSEKSMITAGVGSSINEKDLNKIYNIADGSASIFTSGAFEFTNPESLLAGIPLACPNYSCGEDFCSQDFVYEIKGSLTFEHNTGFEKFVPDINSIVKFFEYIYDLPENKRKDITERGRKWAIEQFDAKNVVKKYEEFFDSCEPINWEEFDKKRSEIKNVNASVEHKDSNDEFITECYSKILGMSPNQEDDGRKYWNQFLSQPGDQNQLRNSMIQSMRGAGQEHNNKVAPKLSLQDLLDKTDKERCLLILKESLGDAYIITSLLPEIKLKYPNASIYLATDPKYWEVFDLNEDITACIPWSQELENEMLVTGFGNQKGLFNYFHNIGLTSQRSLNYLSSKYE